MNNARTVEFLVSGLDKFSTHPMGIFVMRSINKGQPPKVKLGLNKKGQIIVKYKHFSAGTVCKINDSDNPTQDYGQLQRLLKKGVSVEVEAIHLTKATNPTVLSFGKKSYFDKQFKMIDPSYQYFNKVFDEDKANTLWESENLWSKYCIRVSIPILE